VPAVPKAALKEATELSWTLTADGTTLFLKDGVCEPSLVSLLFYLLLLLLSLLFFYYYCECSCCTRGRTRGGGQGSVGMVATAAHLGPPSEAAVLQPNGIPQKHTKFSSQQNAQILIPQKNKKN